MAGNPLFEAFNNPRTKNALGNALSDFGYGLASAPNFGDAFGAAAQRGAQMQPTRDAEYARYQDDLKEQDALNKTTEYLTAQGYTDLLPLVEAGYGSDALKEAFNRQQPGYGQPELTADMQNFQFAQANPEFAGFMNGGRDAPSGYQWTPEGALAAIPGGPAARGSGDVPMNSTIQKELFEADEALQAGQAVIGGLDRALELNQQAWDGPFADQRSGAAALFGNQDGIATQELKNVVTSQALESLKAVFGGMPTEGERKILLEIQGSVDQPKAVREAIYTRAKAAAERRIAENARKADALRSGQYFDSGYSAQTPTAAPNTTSTGLSWSIEP